MGRIFLKSWFTNQYFFEKKLWPKKMLAIYYYVKVYFQKNYKFVNFQIISKPFGNSWNNEACDAPPSSLCDPKRVQRVGFAEMVKNLVPLPTSSTKRGRGVVLEAPGWD